MLAFFFLGGKAVGYVPVLVVGALIFHLSIDLVKESIVDTIGQGMSRLEYFTIVIIIFIMSMVGFTEGVIAV